MKAFDYKKEYKDLYMPKPTPVLYEIPEMKFVSVQGYGDPNEENGAYHDALQLLYGISFTIKMSPKNAVNIDGYFPYTVPPLEGLWWMLDQSMPNFDSTSTKKDFQWISMIRLPEFVTEDVFHWACEQFQKKHPEVDISKASYMVLHEGLCAQMMHLGSYDQEAITIQQLHTFIQQQGYVCDYDGFYSTNQHRRHHEIYLSDPRRSKPENLKTVIRLPIKRK